ncbi:MAG: VCBS repeat-containing protein [Planctomycetaceae bacterium]
MSFALKAAEFRRFLVLGLVFFIGIESLLADDAVRLVDDSYADFSQGTSDDGGNNLYVSRDGSLRTINRYDLNDDGFLDVIFNCTHNTYQMLPATAGSIGENREATSADIMVEGSQQADLGDLNQDGYIDIVFCPNPIGVHHDRRFVMIAWGGPEGWLPERINSPLPTNGAAMVRIVDVNADGWADIAVLSGNRWRIEQPEGRVVRIFWGSEQGFSVTEYAEIGLPSAVAIAAADLDDDDAHVGELEGNDPNDLIVLQADGNITIFWSTQSKPNSWSSFQSQVALPNANGTTLTTGDVTGDNQPDLVVGTSGAMFYVVPSAGNRQFAEAVTVPAYPATHVTVADLDGDHAAEIVLTQFDQARAAGGEQAGAGEKAEDQIHILWGTDNGFSTENETMLNVPLAVATAAGDMDADGHLDLVVAIHQGKETFNGESSVYFGDGNRRFEKGTTGFRTSGTLDVVIAPAERNLPARAVFCNSIGGQLDEAVPLHLFWGGENGFSPDNFWKIPFHSGYEASAADLDADGFTELLIMNSGHAGHAAHSDPTLGANILWGGKEGLVKSTKRSVLHEHFLGTSSVADLNRDGRLDLVLEPFAAEHAGEDEQIFVYYGSDDGFTDDHRVALTLGGYAQEHLVADLNKDQWLDIIVTTRRDHVVRILWGGADGFDEKREQRLKVSGPLGADAADFNSDGWLDLVVGSYDDPKSGHRDMGLIIFWGNEEGFRHWDAQWLPGFSPLGRTIADFDGDGFLDLFSPQHSGELTREDLACHIYWGDKTGFRTRQRTTLFSDSVNDSMAGDFNGDGLIDLAVNSHTRHGDHRTQSRIFYNDGRRFSDPMIQKLPTNGPHLIWASDVGHIYDRKYQQSYLSRVMKWNADKPLTQGVVDVEATMPEGADVKIAIRSAISTDAIKFASWQTANDGSFPLGKNDRVLQYRVELISDNGDRYPIVHRVEIELAP